MEKTAAQKRDEKPHDPKRGGITRHPKPGLARWVNQIVADLSKRNDLTMLRIMGVLFGGRCRTKGKISAELNLWDDLIGEKLDWLKKRGLISDERVSFGIDFLGRKRTIRAYYVTELGRFLLHQMDMQFPGLWLTPIRTEALDCDYSK